MNRFTAKGGGDWVLEEVDDDERANFELAGDERVALASLGRCDGSAGGKDVGIGAVIDCGSMLAAKDEWQQYGPTPAGAAPVDLVAVLQRPTDQAPGLGDIKFRKFTLAGVVHCCLLVVLLRVGRSWLLKMAWLLLGQPT
jgi:hypothetical protein